MLINNCFDFSEVIEIDIRLIKQSILTIQKNIYQAAKKYNKKDLHKWQKKILLKKEILLILLYKIIKILKKKLFYLPYIIKNS